MFPRGREREPVTPPSGDLAAVYRALAQLRDQLTVQERRYGEELQRERLNTLALVRTLQDEINELRAALAEAGVPVPMRRPTLRPLS